MIPKKSGLYENIFYLWINWIFIDDERYLKKKADLSVSSQHLKTPFYNLINTRVNIFQNQ